MGFDSHEREELCQIFNESDASVLADRLAASGHLKRWNRLLLVLFIYNIIKRTGV